MATAQNIIDEVRRIIHDEDSAAYRWSNAELIGYLNAGTRQIVQLVPEANTIQEVVTVNNGIARQTLPSGGLVFVKVARNYADDGTTPQGVIRRVEKDALDTYDPDWEYDQTIKSNVANFFEHYCHDSSEPNVYYLYPPNTDDASKRVALVYAAIPDEMTLVSSTFPLSDQYINAEVQYTVYRALTKESRSTLPDAFRKELWDNFLMALGLQKEARRNAQPPIPPEGE